MKAEVVKILGEEYIKVWDKESVIYIPAKAKNKLFGIRKEKTNEKTRRN